MKELFFWLGRQKGSSLPEMFLVELQVAHDHYLYLNEHVAQQDQKIKRRVKENELCQLLKTVPEIGDMTSSQLVMEVGNGAEFKNGLHMAAWLGLVPRQYSTGGKTTLLGISKRGNKRLWCLFVCSWCLGCLIMTRSIRWAIHGLAQKVKGFKTF